MKQYQKHKISKYRLGKPQGCGKPQARYLNLNPEHNWKPYNVAADPFPLLLACCETFSLLVLLVFIA